MSDFSWIMSGGGPLICVESIYAGSWGGTERLSVPKADAKSDYDRAYDGSHKGLTSAPLANGAALFFQGPFDTSFWRRSRDGKVFVVRIEACEDDTNFESIMESLDDDVFKDPLEILSFSFTEDHLVVFDSAEPGDEPDKKSIDFRICPGSYQIATRFIESTEYFLTVHKFDLMNY